MSAAVKTAVMTKKRCHDVVVVLFRQICALYFVICTFLFFSFWVGEIFVCIGDSLTKVKVVKVRKVIKVLLS